LTLRGGEIFYHPTENRYLTPREYLRIHTFPDSLVLQGPIRRRSGNVRNLDQHRLVANAVPPKLAEILAKEIIKAI
jgi:DNA (cytosine-5)-methyltransferase 1